MGIRNEELLKPRYIIIADWPQVNINPFHVGDILVENSIYFTRKENTKSMHWKKIVKYPHLFRLLHWSEERDIREMPRYLRVKYREVDPHSTLEDDVYKVVRWKQDGNSFAAYVDNDLLAVVTILSFVYPATEEEYLQYTQRK